MCVSLCQYTVDIAAVDEEDNDGAESESSTHSSSVFSRLEKTRVELEKKIGIGPLLQAYQLIQVCVCVCVCVCELCG